jgi:glutamine synthetase
MGELELSVNPNPLVWYLKKLPSEFTCQDLIRFIENNGIEMVNFRYVAEDGKLKELNFVINSKEHLRSILTFGERVDGSSLFSYIDAGSSDLYLIPRYRTAYLNPFSHIPALDILCSFYNNTGKPLENSPENVLHKAYRNFMDSTGLHFKAMGELEYYVNSKGTGFYDGEDQKGYQSSQPFSKWEDLRVEAMKLIARCGGKIKYGHAEVGTFIKGEELFEQHEIEFLPVEVEESVEQLLIAKWILRMLGKKYGVEISFAPKITVGKAGSGLHIHMLLEKDGRNIMVEEGKLSDTARKMIAGIIDVADALTAFGNTIPTSYLRLVPHQEAPTNICWGDRNRSVLIRVPLGWLGNNDMILDANPQQQWDDSIKMDSRQTVEFRAPDGSADLYNLLAGLVVATHRGLNLPDALERATRSYIDVGNIKKENKPGTDNLQHLPTSCWDSADSLTKKREIFEMNNIFPEGMIDSIVRKLKSYDDKDLSDRLIGNDEELRKLVIKYIHTC